jgi:hypothetical protein
MATLQVPPLVEGTQLMPRTIVHVFFLDAYASSNPFTSNVAPTDNGTEDPTAREEAQRRRETTMFYPQPCGSPKRASDNTKYKLLFAGEVVGFTWTKNPTNRSLILQCQDFSNYWDYAYQWNNSGIFGPGLKAVFSGGATNLFTDFLSSKGSMVTAIVSSGRCNTFPKLRGLAAGVVRLIESIGGSYYTGRTPDGKAPRKFGGQNVFFSIAELRLHITQMIAAYEDDPTSQRIMGRQGYSGMFNRMLGGMGSQVSIRKAITALTKVMFHQTYPQSCPRYIPGTDKDVSGSARTLIADDPEWGVVAANAWLAEQSVESFQSQLTQLDTDNATLPATLRRANSKTQILDIRNRVGKLATEMSKVQADSQLYRAPGALNAIFSTAIRELRRAHTGLRQWGASPSPYTRNLVTNSLEQARLQFNRAKDLTVPTRAQQERIPARLNQQIFRPNIWFGPPPRCNVLFPEQYEMLTYQRSFLQEPTRFLLKTNDEFFGEDFLFDRFYFAPQAGSLKKEQANLKDMLRNDILDHELFTGILPVFEKMGEFNIFADKSRQSTNGLVSKVSAAQRSANFIYFNHRFNARRMSVTARFSPYVAVGFPGVVVDSYLDKASAARFQELREEYRRATGVEAPPGFTRELAGTNFLGNFTEVVHQVSHQQMLGKTNITVTYPRQPNESVEFLGTTERSQTVEKRMDDAVREGEDIAAISSPAINSIGPNGGRITARVEVTGEYLPSSSSSISGIEGEFAGVKLPVFFSGIRRRGKLPDVLVPVGVLTTARELNSVELGDFLGDMDREVIFKAFRITEEVPSYRVENVDLPAEELIRPGWYGDIWSPSKIGKVYDYFFGTTSITDPTVVVDRGAGGGTRPAPNEEREAASEDQTDALAPDDAEASQPSVVELEEGATIEQAVDFLVMTYSYVRTAGLDVDEFVRSYTWRPIATLMDMFGSDDLEYDEKGERIVSNGAIEGFHSRAFGPYDNLFGLVAPEIEDIIGMKRGSPSAQRADTRKRKLEKVLAYVDKLTFSRALLA